MKTKRNDACEVEIPTDRIANRTVAATRFAAPSLDDVAGYCRERSNQVDPRAFVDYYTARGWKMGSSSMRDWRAAVRTWERRQTNGERAEQSEVRQILAGHAVWDAWKEMPDGSEKYQAYLCSPEWGRLRAAVTERSNGTCERCEANPAAAVHHLTYARKYREELDDLIHECDGCHKYSHGLSDVDPIIEHLKAVGQVPLDRCLIDAGCEWMDPASLLRCPVCKFDYVHIGRFAEIDTHDVAIDGLGRGGAVELECHCESGHSWRLVFTHHKGRTYSFCRDIGLREEYENAEPTQDPASVEGPSPVGLLENGNPGPSHQNADTSGWDAS